jgi:hypothetical protein
VNRRDPLGFTGALADGPTALADYRASGPRNDGRVPHVTRWTARGWNAARQTLEPFAELTNEGDEEGALFIDRLPLPDEPEVHPPTLNEPAGTRAVTQKFLD